MGMTDYNYRAAPADGDVFWSKNQNGISQTNELYSLESQNISELNVTRVANRSILANGNQLGDLGSYTRSDGSVGTMADLRGWRHRSASIRLNN